MDSFDTAQTERKTLAVSFPGMPMNLPPLSIQCENLFGD